jgi:hypothetical protein
MDFHIGFKRNLKVTWEGEANESDPTMDLTFEITYPNDNGTLLVPRAACLNCRFRSAFDKMGHRAEVFWLTEKHEDASRGTIIVLLEMRQET